MKKAILSLIVVASLVFVPLRIFAKNTEDWHKRGNEFFKSEEYEKAIDAYTKSLELQPNALGPLMNRGKAYLMIHSYRQAIEDFSRAIKLNPKLTPAYSGRGFAYARLGW